MKIANSISSTMYLPLLFTFLDMGISDVVGFYTIFTSSSKQPSPYYKSSQPIQQHHQQQRSSSSYPTTSILSTRLHLSSSSSSSPNIQPPPNEFSRIFKTDKLQSSTSSRRRSSSDSRREILMKIEATTEECELLAKRFDLQDLKQLDADLKLKSAPGPSGSSATAAVVVQVEGTISAKLTRTCVRTCEEFPVDIELPFRSIVRPISDSFWDDVETALALDDYDKQQNQQQQSKKNKKKKKNTKNPRRNNNFNDIDMRDLESQLTLQLLMDDDDDDDDAVRVENNVVEDEAIYSLNNDNLDVGELVAQTFWLNLDPYPKKPGTDPMELSITG